MVIGSMITIKIKEISQFLRGIPRNRIPFTDIVKLFNGNILSKELPIRFNFYT